MTSQSVRDRVEAPRAAHSASALAPPRVPERANGGRDVPVLVAGRYRVECLLGRGGMGTVWLAQDEMLHRPVAIKEFTVPESTLNGARARELAIREAQAGAQVCHPGVVQVYDVVIDDGRPWIVMEALSGPTLAQTIRKDGSLPVERVVDIGLQLLDALRAVHGGGVVHRDVKPSNVQLCADGRVVLTDFGVAAAVDDACEDEPGELFGSPPYTAPEAIAERRFGPASDLFSLGATLYAAAQGHQPFSDLTPFSTLAAVVRSAPSPAVHDDRLRPVIDGLLVREPDERMGVQEASDRLREVESDLGLARPTEPAARSAA